MEWNALEKVLVGVTLGSVATGLVVGGTMSYFTNSPSPLAYGSNLGLMGSTASLFGLALSRGSRELRSEEEPSY